MKKIGNMVFLFNKDIVETVNHAKQVLRVNDGIKKLFSDKHIYTKEGSKECRFGDGNPIWVHNNAVIEEYCVFLSGGVFHTMGAFSSSASRLPLNTIVGRYCSIATGVTRLGGNHPYKRFMMSNITYGQNLPYVTDYFLSNNMDVSAFLFKANPYAKTNYSPIVIGNDVWIGNNVTFLSQGIHVGDGAVIAANSLVTKDIPPYTIVGGNPARFIKYRFPLRSIESLLELRWWEYGLEAFTNLDFDMDIEEFIEHFSDMKRSGDIKPLQVEEITAKDFCEAADMKCE